MKKAIFIDLCSIAHPAWHVSQADPNPDSTSIKTVEAVRRLAGNAPFVAVCCDAGRSFRKDIDPDYKGTRPAQEAALSHQIKLAMETLKLDGFPVWAVPGFEADDLLATAADLALSYAEKQGEGDPAFTVEILSSDKDLLQLIGPRVAVRSIATGKYYDETGVIEKLGVAPHQVVDWLALVGDTSDNIKGCKGIGPKGATELLTKYGNLDDLYSALRDHGTEFTPARASALQEFKPRVEQVRELITLRKDVPLPFDELFRPRTSEEAIFSGEDEPPPAPAPPPPAPPEPPAPPAVQPPLQFPSRLQTEPSIPINPPIIASEAQAGPGAPTPVNARPMPEPAAPTTAGPPAAPTPAIALVDQPAGAPVDWRQQLEPRSMQQAAWLAEAIHKSRLFSAYGSAHGVLTTVLAGREFGLQAMAALRGFHIIDGKPSMSADLIRALVLKSGLAEYFRCTERTATKATFVTKRRGDPEMSMTYTIEEARTAWQKDDRAWANSSYGKNPADMLIARCGSKLARLVYPEVAFGLYAPSELSADPVDEGVN